MSICKKLCIALFTVNNLKTLNPCCRIYFCCIKSSSLIFYKCWLFIVYQSYLQKIAFYSDYTYLSILELKCQSAQIAESSSQTRLPDVAVLPTILFGYFLFNLTIDYNCSIEIFVLETTSRT